MSAKDLPDDAPNTETEDETVAARRKRSRRVSFADVEITSVHIFKRDEDYYDSTTPSDPKPDGPDSGGGSDDAGLRPLFRDLGDHSDDSRERTPSGDYEKEDGEEEEVVARKSFLRLIGSPSPGSSMFGSATSNDEDNFFGPVSASFIKPGRLSDSAASDENHDVTMDSTAFSMHFRSLARSDSGTEKLPTSIHLKFDEKTPSEKNTPANSGSFMMLTNARRLTPESARPMHSARSDGKDSNEMSLIGNNPNRYDYGRLSPSLDALLAEGSEDLQALPSYDVDNVNALATFEVSNADESGSSKEKVEGFADDIMSTMATDGTNQITVAVCRDLDKAHSASEGMRIQNFRSDTSIMVDGFTPDAPVYQHIHTPNQTLKLGSVFQHVSEVPIKEISPRNGSQNLDSIEQDLNRLHTSHLKGSISSLAAKRRQLFLGTISSPANFSIASPSAKTSGSLLRKERTQHGSSLSSIWKNIPKFGNLDSSPSSARLKEINALKVKLSGYLSSSPSNTIQAEANKDLNRLHTSHLKGSISSLAAKRRQLFLGTISSPANFSIASPSAKTSGSLLRKERTQHGSSLSSIWKNIPKFGNLDSSPSSARLKEINALKVKLSGYLSSSPSNTIQAEANKDVVSKFTESPVAVAVAVHDSGPMKTPLISMIKDDFSQTEKTVALCRNGQSPGCASSHINHNDQPVTVAEAIARPDNFSVAGGVMQPQSMSKSSENAALVSLKADPSLDEIAVTCRKDIEDPIVSQRLSTSPLQRFNHELLPSGNDQSTHGVSMQQDWYRKSIGIDSHQFGSPLQSVASGGCPTEDVNKIKSCFLERISPRGRNMLGLQSLKPLKDLQTEIDGASSIDEVSHGGREVCSLLPDSTNPNKSTDVPLPKKSLFNESAWNVNKEIHNMPHHENMQSIVGESLATSKSDAFGILSNENQQEPGHSESTLTSQEIKECLRQKRKGDVHEDGDPVSKVAKTTGSSETKRSEGYDVNSSLEHPKNSCMERENNGYSIQPCRNWKDVFKKFLDDSRKIPSSLVDKLDMRTINVLDETLVYLQKVKNYELLSSDIHTKRAGQSRSASEKRSYEIISRLYTVVHLKERLRLNCLKRERLQKTEQILRSSIQEFQALKLITKKTSLLTGESGCPDDYQCSTQSGNQYEVARNPLALMKQEMETLEKKIENLTKPLNRFCKMKGELDCIETIGLINNFMKKRMCCRFVRLDLQLWKVNSFESKRGHHNITLDYLGLIYQRLSLTAYPVPGLTVSNKLVDTKIEQSYPNMAAGTAFAFVFNSKTIKKYATSKCLAKETQMTHLVLRNLLDVLEELLLARLEIKSLTHARFFSSREGQLDLLLSFIDFHSDQKVALSLDMTCLNCGLYPSEVLPYRVEASLEIISCSLLPQSLSKEITTTIERLPVGYSRILRLCQCVSEELQEILDLILALCDKLRNQRAVKSEHRL